MLSEAKQSYLKLLNKSVQITKKGLLILTQATEGRSQIGHFLDWTLTWLWSKAQHQGIDFQM